MINEEESGLQKITFALAGEKIVAVDCFSDNNESIYLLCESKAVFLVCVSKIYFPLTAAACFV